MKTGSRFNQESLIFLDFSEEFGGAARYLITLLNHLINKRLSFRILIGTQNEKIEHALIAEHITFFERFYTYSLRRYLLRPLSLLFTVNSLAAICRKSGRTLIVTNSFRAHILGILLAFRASDIVCCCIIHDYTFPRAIVYLLRWSKKIVFSTVSNSLCTYYRSNPSTIINNGFDFSRVLTDDARKDIAMKYALDYKKKWIIGVGNYARLKGLETFLHIAKHFASADDDKQFIWVGEKSNSKYDMHSFSVKQIKDLALSNVVLIPIVDDFYSLLGNCDICLSLTLPRYGGPESFGRVLIEAMFLGVPVISTNVGEPPYYITDGKTGLLVNPESTEEFAQSINRYCSDADFVSFITVNAKVTAARYSVESCFRGLVRVASSFGFDLLDHEKSS